MNTVNSTSLKCPICKSQIDRIIPTLEKSYFPFCGKRCQLLDLGAWAKEDYRVASEIKESTESDESEE